MEGSHTILQLRRPIVELCYVSFCLPKGRIRGFTYKGCITLDKSSRCFHNCYQVKEGLEVDGSQGKNCENIGEIFFKQTTTKDILTELYRLNAEKERLLTTLLSSGHIVGVKMGIQGGKLQDVSESLNCEDQQESFSGSIEKWSIAKTKKTRKSSKRRESIEDIIKKVKRKVSATLEPLALQSKETLENDKYHADVTSRFLTCSYQEKVERRDEISSDMNKVLECSGKERYLLEDSPLLESDTDFSISFSEYDNDVLGHCCVHASHSLLDDEHTFTVMQQRASLPNSSQEHSVKKSTISNKTVASEMVHDYSHIPEICKNASKIRGTSKTKDWKNLSEAVSTFQKYDRMPNATTKEIKESFGSMAVMTEKGHKYPIRLSNREQDHPMEEKCSLVGAVNKALQKVIQIDRLDETIEGKKLEHEVMPSSFFHEKKERRTRRLQNGNNNLALHLELKPDICQPRTSNNQEEKGTTSMTLTRVSNIFNHSYPPSSSHKQMPRLSSLSTSLPSQQSHHPIFPLTSLHPGKVSVCIDHCSSRRSSSDLPLCNDLEAQVDLKSSKTGYPGLSGRQQGFYQDTSEDNCEISNSQETVTISSQHQLFSGMPAESAVTKNSEQTMKTPVASRNDEAWVLGCRLVPSDPSHYFTESERKDRKNLHLELNPCIGFKLESSR